MVAHFAGDAVSNQARAVEGVRASCTPYIRFAKLGIGSINYRVACYGLDGTVVYRTAPIVLRCRGSGSCFTGGSFLTSLFGSLFFLRLFFRNNISCASAERLS